MAIRSNFRRAGVPARLSVCRCKTRIRNSFAISDGLETRSRTAGEKLDEKRAAQMDLECPTANFLDPLVLCSAAINCCATQQSSRNHQHDQSATGTQSGQPPRVGGRGFFGRWSAMAPEMQGTAARVCGRSSISDRTPAICECSAIDHRPLRTIPHLSSCCTDAPKRQLDTILGPDGRPLRTATVLRCFCRSSSGPTIPMAVLIGFSPNTAGAIKANLFRFGR